MRTNFKPLELEILSKIFNFVFDKGMLQAIEEGTQEYYIEDKKYECMTSPKIKRIFTAIDPKWDYVDMSIVNKAIEFAQTAHINRSWLKFHKISLLGENMEGKIVALLGSDIVFNLRADAQKNGNKFIKPLSEHIASTVNNVQKGMTSIKQFRKVFAKEYKVQHSESSILELIKAF